MIKHSVNSGLIHELRIPIQTQPVTRLPIQRSIKRTKKEPGVVTHNPGKKAFTLFFNGDKLPVESTALQTVPVNSVEEASEYLLLLGETCEIFLSVEYRIDNPALYASLRALSYPPLSDWPSLAVERAVSLMQKLPFDLKSLVNSPIAITSDDQLPERIDQKFVHKKNKANVLVSEIFSAGKLIYFNMLDDTDELIFDHASDHVQGMLMLEALRQGAVAMTHILGLSFDGQLALLNYNTNFFHYLERDTPVVLRAFGGFAQDEKSEDRNITVYLQVMQWGKVCADATLTACAFGSTQRYQQQKERIEKISSRSKMQFKTKVSRIHEVQSTLKCA
ncbi:AfsA-related hotdog domain-containing protein [Chlorobium ferrooxidans]|uniref:A-factor biosynthesis hotdog domain-containing protein n=1 Tax=Chlorobium ferrooxidans DSM 13031 TaxID=377431 RepID=Q0YPI5_9CHLB|nr:AfsA-related hotdog domain-containing protein [Chlorobium ferrooxidans]EAT58195.1 conserved hypothetical protein [Chlorobium ferrooxidans DSM 13031]